MHGDINCPGAPEGWHGVCGASGPHGAHALTEEPPTDGGGDLGIPPSSKVRLPDHVTKLRKRNRTDRREA
jgi:hypothetical protein